MKIREWLGRESPSGGSQSQTGTPRQQITLDSIRDAGRALAQAMGKTYESTLYTSIKVDETKVFFNCTNGEYRSIIRADTIEIYTEHEGGKLVHSMKRR